MPRRCLRRRCLAAVSALIGATEDAGGEGAGPAMRKYVCNVCGYVYDPERGDPDNGIAPGTAFEDISDDWTCPVCGVPKEDFSPAD